MNTNICERILNEMLIEKTTTYAQDAFRVYYEMMFPSHDLFVKFLRPNTQELTTKMAKELFARLQFSLLCPIPHEYSDSLLYVESDTNNVSDDFFPQDHYVHSIYVYVIGIYLFFNHESIHELILAQIASPTECGPRSNITFEKVRMFITSWTYFSLYHDIGYVFEKPLEKSGEVRKRANLPLSFFEKYTQCEDYISYELALKSFSRLFLADTIFRLSKRTLIEELDTIPVEKKMWRRLTEDNVYQKVDMISSLTAMYDFTCLHNISTYRNLKVLSPFLSKSRYVAIVYDAHDEPIALKAVLSEDVAFFGSGKCDFSVSNFETIEQIGDAGASEFSLHCKYFFPDLQGNVEAALKKSPIRHFKEYIPEAFEHMRSDNSPLFSFFTRKSSLSDMHYAIYKHLRERIPFDSFESSFLERTDSISKSIIKSALSSVIDKKAKGFLDTLKIDSMLSEDDLKGAFEGIGALFSDIDAEDIVEVIRGAQKHDIDSHKTLFDCIYRVQKEFSNILTSKDTFVKTDEKTKKVSMIPMNTSRRGKNKNGGLVGCEDAKRLFFDNMKRSLKPRLEMLGFLTSKQKTENFLSYSPSYAYIDHGICSAAILANVLASYSVIGDNCTSDGSLETFSFPFFADETKQAIASEILRVENTSLFSILIHNVYVSAYSEQTGNRYLQDIQKDAFSYFSSLCDNLQYWNRNHQHNPAIHDTPYSYYAGDCDMKIRNNKIIITCKTPNLLSTVNARKNSLEEYMLDANTLIILKVEEEL